MHNLIVFVLFLPVVVMSPLAMADKPPGAIYLDGGKSKTALILCHGRGKYPNWLVVDPLRKKINEDLGYHTLSLQMPNNAKNWRQYGDDFPEAYKTINAGIRYLQEEQGVQTIFLMGHSMGARMASAFAADNPDHALAGLIVAGCRNNGEGQLSCMQNLQRVELPVLDIWGAASAKDVVAGNQRRVLGKPQYVQIELAVANHKFEGEEQALVTAVIQWLEGL